MDGEMRVPVPDTRTTVGVTVPEPPSVAMDESHAFELFPGRFPRIRIFALGKAFEYFFRHAGIR